MRNQNLIELRRSLSDTRNTVALPLFLMELSMLGRRSSQFWPASIQHNANKFARASVLAAVLCHSRVVLVGVPSFEVNRSLCGSTAKVDGLLRTNRW